MQNPWDALPKDLKGDGNINVLYSAVGRALSEWENLEAKLGRVFAHLCGSHSEAPERAYGVIASSTGRIDILREAFNCHPARRRTDLEGFLKFTELVRKFGGRRNEIAHGMAIHLTTDRGEQGHFLCPASYNSRKQMSRADILESLKSDPEFASHSSEWAIGKYAYTSRQILSYAKHFELLGDRAMEFLGALWGWEAEQRKEG